MSHLYSQRIIAHYYFKEKIESIRGHVNKHADPKHVNVPASLPFLPNYLLSQWKSCPSSCQMLIPPVLFGGLCLLSHLGFALYLYFFSFLPTPSHQCLNKHFKKGIFFLKKKRKQKNFPGPHVPLWPLLWCPLAYLDELLERVFCRCCFHLSFPISFSHHCALPSLPSVFSVPLNLLLPMS